MKKNLKLIISVICVSVSLIICAVMIHFSNKNFVEDVFLGSDIEDGVDEYLISQGYVKAPESEVGVWLTEYYDTDFTEESEELEKTLKELKKSVFGSVFIRSNYFSGKGENDGYNESLKNLKNLSEKLKEQNKKMYLEMSLQLSEEAFTSVAPLCDAIILTDSENLNAEKLNSKLLKVVRYIEKANENAKTYISLSLDSDISKINKKATDGICVLIDKNTDISVLNVWDKTLKMSGSELICTADVDYESTSCVRSFYEGGKCESITSLSVSSYKDISKNKDAYSAIKEYLKNGIVPEIAFRELTITGFDGGTVETNEFTSEIEIYGSNIFPAYLNGEELDLGETGSKKLSFNLTEGENIFTFEQCGKKIDYRVNMTFDGEIIRSVMPGDTVTVQPKEKITVMVIAYSGAEITVKVGTKEYKAKREEGAETGYAAFRAKITMPKTKEEIDSLGMISVNGTVGDRTIQQKGAMIVCGEEMTTLVPVTNENETTTAIQLGNFVQELIDDKYEYTTLPTAVTAVQTTASLLNQSFTGNQMCVITEPYADTRPLIYNDDTYVPSYSTLVQGTMDYVTAQSTAYNSDENETVYFYELASGRKVKCEHAQLVYANLGKNSLNVVSSESENGTLTIRLQTNWKVPYAISHTPQNYFTSYGSKYNLSSFNANYIQIDFYHTGSATGNVDVKGSNVVSSASWSVSGDKVSLTMPLISVGKYYGTSVSYDENGYMVITVHNNPQTLQGTVILLDPGHGGDDPGALGIGEQVKESDVNIAVAYAARDALRAKGATVYMTRQGNETLSLDQRKNIAYSLKPDLYVSIHSNGSERSSDIGTSVYYYKSFSQSLASNIYNEMIKVFKNNLYYGQQELYDDLSDGARYYPFSVTRLEDCPSVLIETGFMTNDNECYKLIQSSTHSLFGQAIADGIEKTVTG